LFANSSHAAGEINSNNKWHLTRCEDKTENEIDRRLCRRMIDGRVLIHRAADDQRPIRKSSLGNRRRGQPHGLVRNKKNVFIIRPAFRVVLFLVGVFGESLPQLTAAATVHLEVTSVLAKVLGDIILVGVEIGDDNSLAEGGGHKGQQQKKGCALSNHSPVEVSAKIEQNAFPDPADG
jgi:hypothetical protein